MVLPPPQQQQQQQQQRRPQQERCGILLQRILFCPTEERTARELQGLDKASRQQVWADMTGHAAAIEYRMHAESPELISQRLHLLTLELAKQPPPPPQPQPQHRLHTQITNVNTNTSMQVVPPCSGPDDEAYDLAVQQDAAYGSTRNN